MPALSRICSKYPMDCLGECFGHYSTLRHFDTSTTLSAALRSVRRFAHCKYSLFIIRYSLFNILQGSLRRSPLDLRRVLRTIFGTSALRHFDLLRRRSVQVAQCGASLSVNILQGSPSDNIRYSIFDIRYSIFSKGSPSDNIHTSPILRNPM